MSADHAEQAPAPADRRDVCAYVEDMVMDLASMASRVGETSLAASLALVGIQAGAARRAGSG